MKAKDAVIWINADTREVRVARVGEWSQPSSQWCDPIGAHYASWHEGKQQMLTMLETAIDLAMQGFDLGDVLRAFAEIDEFKALGTNSYPMCRALNSALFGRCLEDFEALED
jgi:hypothetical protein